MDRKRAKELLPIIEAYAEGAKIESRCGEQDTWGDVISTAFHDQYDFRIKPEPREFWIKATAPNLHIGALIRNVPTTDDGWIKVREVL